MDHAKSALQFPVLDELHMYRGRQGADVAMPIRRLTERCGKQNRQHIGTSATMVTGFSERFNHSSLKLGIDQNRPIVERRLECPANSVPVVTRQTRKVMGSMRGIFLPTRSFQLPPFEKCHILNMSFGLPAQSELDYNWRSGHTIGRRWRSHDQSGITIPGLLPRDLRVCNYVIFVSKKGIARAIPFSFVG